MAGLALTLAILFFASSSVPGGSRSLAGSRDFVSYWATGHQLVQHANPYDRDAISALEHAAGLDVRAVLIMRNPPWALPLAYPLGFLAYAWPQSSGPCFCSAACYSPCASRASCMDLPRIISTGSRWPLRRP